MNKIIYFFKKTNIKTNIKIKIKVNMTNYRYSLQATLFDDETNQILFENTVYNKKLFQTGTKMMTHSIISHEQSKKSFMLYVTDLTNYLETQPLLQLDIVVHYLSGGNNQKRIPLSFFSKSRTNYENRRIEVALPPMTDLEIHLAYSRM